MLNTPFNRFISNRSRFAATAALFLGLLAAAALLTRTSHAADRFPSAEWDRAKAPEDVGWSSEKLTLAKEFAESIETAAVMVVHDGLIVWDWGETDRVFRAHSIRKSMLSALYGIYIAEDVIDVNNTMADLGIDDNEPSLTETEKTATVLDLLKSRSGIFHPALYESESVMASKPPRGTHPPGAYWLYSNWDFNVLGTIFDRSVGSSLYVEFEDRIANPVQMQDFDRKRDTAYITGDLSVHPAYTFQISARDLARFGLLYARNGRWNDRQIVPEQWIAESTKPHSNAFESGGYGYMWWVADKGRHLPNVRIPEGSFSAQGANGHYLLVLPDWDLIVVHRVNTYIGKQVTSSEFGSLLYRILDARPIDLAPDFDIVPSKLSPLPASGEA